ncbi:hypothetical protein FJ364_03215 [Candidatus Dependentiae bacterium]|nr:hypothetical protein [Candidatus Dependentiae bacterium]
MKIYQLLFFILFIISSAVASPENTIPKKPLVYPAKQTQPIFHSNTFSYLAMILTMAQITTPYTEKYGVHPKLTCTGCEKKLSHLEFFTEAQNTLLLKIMLGSDRIEVFKVFINRFAELLQKEDLCAIATFMFESFKNEELICYPCPDCKKNNTWIYDPNNA